MEEGAGRKVGSCFFAAGRRLATDFYDGGTLRPPYFSLIFAATPAHTSRRHAGSARPLATAGAEPPKKAAADEIPPPSPIPTDVPAHRADCRSIHAIKTSTTYRCSRAVSSRPAGIACHLARQPRQQQAVAC